MLYLVLGATEIIFIVNTRTELPYYIDQMIV
jgi:hypothetical protein